MTVVNNAIASETQEAKVTTPKFEVGQVWSNEEGYSLSYIISEDADFVYGQGVHHGPNVIYRWGKKDGKYYGRVGRFETDHHSSRLDLAILLGSLDDMPSPLRPDQTFKVYEKYITRGGDSVTIVSDRFNHNGWILFLGLVNRPDGQIAVPYNSCGGNYKDYNDHNLNIIV